MPDSPGYRPDRLWIHDRSPNGAVRVRQRLVRPDGTYHHDEPWGCFASEPDAHAAAAAAGLEIREAAPARATVDADLLVEALRWLTSEAGGSNPYLARAGAELARLEAEAHG